MSLASPASRPIPAAAPRSAVDGVVASSPADSPGRRRALVAAVLLTLLATSAGACNKGSDVATTPSSTGAPPATGRILDTPSTADGTRSTGANVLGTDPTSTTAPVSTSSVVGGGPSTTVATPTTAPIVSSSTSAASAPSTTKPGAPPASAAAFCARNSQATSDFESLDPTKDFAPYLTKLREVTAELAGLAPAAIKADVQTVADAFAKITTAEQIDAMTNDPQIKAAGDRVSDWTKANCPQP
jgi:hypothetical protein